MFGPDQQEGGELRPATNGIAYVTVLNNPAFGTRQAVILSESRTGLLLEISTPLEAGAHVKIRMHDTVVFGEVGSVRANGAGCYRAGVVVIALNPGLDALALKQLLNGEIP